MYDDEKFDLDDFVDEELFDEEGFEDLSLEDDEEGFKALSLEGDDEGFDMNEMESFDEAEFVDEEVESYVNRVADSFEISSPMFKKYETHPNAVPRLFSPPSFRKK